MADTVNVALSGGGRTGSLLLQELLKYPYINIVGIADTNTSAEGHKVAQQKGIYATTDPMELAQKGEEIDVLIEVTGDSKLKQKIKDLFESSGNKKTIIMHDLIARLLISMSTGQKELIPTFHPDDIGIGG